MIVDDRDDPQIQETYHGLVDVVRFDGLILAHRSVEEDLGPCATSSLLRCKGGSIAPRVVGFNILDYRL